jgi:putative colanic acid biosynthesis UDP-glucose lipid carrier transferase
VATPAEGSGVARHWRFAGDGRAALQLCVAAADILGVAIAGIVSYLIWERTLGMPAKYWGQIIVVCVDFVLVMQLSRMYRFAVLRRPRHHLVRLTCLWAALVLVLSMLVYPSRAGEYSRVWILLWTLSGWLALLATRLFAWWTIRRFRRQLITRVVVVGNPVAARHFAQRLVEDADGDADVVGVFEARDFLGSANDRNSGALARSQAGDRGIDEIVLAMPCSDALDLDAALGELGPRVIDIKLGFGVGASRRGSGRPLIMVPVWHRPLAGLPTVLKRAIDVCASAILLVFLLPLIVVVAALIKLDSRGPVLFQQQRFGLGQQPFNLYKFRSMRCDAASDPSGPQARRHDPRVTRIGRFLRRTSLDELPQLLNVLRGDMSLVGPRPHPIPFDREYAELIEGYSARYHVKPGITGWAQVHGWRGETETLEKMRRRVEFDIYYINHWSLLLDLRILFRTLLVVPGQRNAY